jgi:MFS family permease
VGHESIVLGGYISVLTNHVMNMVLPKMMSDLGTDVITIRWVVTAYMIANAVVMPLSAWLARTLGARDLYIGRGLGLGLSYAVIYPIAISGLEPARGKAATTLLNLCVTLGGALNVSMLAALLEQRQQVRYALLAETQLLSSVGTQQALRALEATAVQIGGALSPTVHAKVLLSRLLDQESLLLAFNDAFSTFVLISLCGLALGFFFRHARPPQR